MFIRAPSQVERLAASGTAISHCPCSNAALGSGLFPLRLHLDAGVKCALGTDVGGGIGFGMLKEGLQAYLMQRLAPDGVMLNAGHLLYLATGLVRRRWIWTMKPETSVRGKRRTWCICSLRKAARWRRLLSSADDAERILAALFTLAGAESIREVRVEGATVYRSQQGH